MKIPRLMLAANRVLADALDCPTGMRYAVPVEVSPATNPLCLILYDQTIVRQLTLVALLNLA